MCRKTSIYLYLVLQCLYTTGIAQPAYLLHNAYLEKYKYCDSVYRHYERKDSLQVFQQLTDFETWATNNGDPELAGEFAITYIRLKQMSTRGPDPDIENRLQQIAESASGGKQLCLEADALQTLGLYYWDKCKKHISAFEQYLAAYKCYKDISPETFPCKQSYISTLGTAYYLYDDYDSAILYLREAMLTRPGPKIELAYSICNTLGLCYRKQKQYDSSDLYFRKIYEGSDPQWVTIAGGNIGINYFLQHRYTEAIPLLEKDIDKSLSTNQNLKNAANSMCVLATIYNDNNDAGKAEQLLLKALNICEGKGFWPNYELAGHLYTQLSKTYATQNNMRLAYLYADSALMAKDSVDAQRNYQSLAKVLEREEFAQHRLEIEQLTNQKKYRN